MNGSAQQKSDEHRARPGQLIASHRRRVHMPEQELMYRPVPLARELVPGSRIPPEETGFSIKERSVTQIRPYCQRTFSSVFDQQNLAPLTQSS